MTEVSFAILESIDPPLFSADENGLPKREGPPLPGGAFGAFHDLRRRILSKQLSTIFENEHGFVVAMTAEQIESYIDQKWPDAEDRVEPSRTSDPRAFASLLDRGKKWALVGRVSSPAKSGERPFVALPDAMDHRHRIRESLDALMAQLEADLNLPLEAIAGVALLHLRCYAPDRRGPTRKQQDEAFLAWGGFCQYCHLPVTKPEALYRHERRRIRGQHEPANLKIYHLECHNRLYEKATQSP